MRQKLNPLSQNWIHRKLVSNCHVASCTGSAIKMWHVNMKMNHLKMNESPAIIVKYNNMPLPSPLLSDQVPDQIPDWIHNIIIGDWVIVQYDNVRYPGEVTIIKGEDIQVNVMVPAGKQIWKWSKHNDCIFYQSNNILKKTSTPETSSGASGCVMFQFPDM